MREMSTMKLAAALAACVFATACEKNPSKLDSVTQKAPPVGADRAGGANSADVADLKKRLADVEQQLKKWEKPMAVTEAAIDREQGKQIGGPDVAEGRLRAVEQNLAKREEALTFLDTVWGAQKAREAALNATYGVNIDEAVKAGQAEGPANALVTIVEAWDFA
jgi:hypothetical protein